MSVFRVCHLELVLIHSGFSVYLPCVSGPKCCEEQFDRGFGHPPLTSISPQTHESKNIVHNINNLTSLVDLKFQDYWEAPEDSSSSICSILSIALASGIWHFFHFRFDAWV